MEDLENLDVNNLPDDANQLKELIVGMAGEIRFLREQFNLAIHRRFAASSEKARYPGQHELFDEAETQATDIEDEIADDADGATDIPVTPRAKGKPGRKPLPAHLPRIEIIHDLPEAAKVCTEDGHALHCIGEDISEQLEIVPAKFQVIRHVRYKYACRFCETGIKTAAMPAQVIPKSFATP